MTEPSVIPPGGGEIVGDSPDRRVEILSDHDGLHATRSRFGPGREGADLHVHRRHIDFFYVLEGELTVRLGPGGERVVVPAGTLAQVPPLVVHGFLNAGDEDVRYLNLHAPGRGFAEFMRALGDGRTQPYDQEPPPPDGGRPTTEAVVGLEELVAERPGLRVALLADVEEIGISETLCDPGSPSCPAQPPGRHVDSLYVLAGEIAITVGDRGLRAQTGSWIQLPPGVPHAVSLPGAEPARLLHLRTPSCGFGAGLRAAFDHPPSDTAS